MTGDGTDDRQPPGYARLSWDEQGQPHSSAFDDVYFSSADGLAETRHVFLQHNQLTERFDALSAPHFTIAETGFGSGLNFLAAWQLWEQRAPANAQLHFVSVEKYPLRPEDLCRALALWPALADYADALCEAYPPEPLPGFHRLSLARGRVQLTLIIDDAAQGFEQLLASNHPLWAKSGPFIDAWFLDGFAPAKNPAMWSDALFSAIGKLSRTGTTAATFSAAGVVKRGLRSAGFAVKRVPGFGRKREMVTATFAGTTPSDLDPKDYDRPMGKHPWPLAWHLKAAPEPTPTRTIAIIGAGLAGCHSARALAERGWQVSVYERAEAPATQASGNPQGVVYCRLSPKDEPQARFNLASLQFARQHYRRYWADCGRACGVLQLAHTGKEAAGQALLRERYAQAARLVQFVDAAEASRLAGVPLDCGGLFLPDAGWLDPRQLCRRLLAHPAITLHTGADVDQLVRDENQWLLLDKADNTLGLAPQVVIATAEHARQFSQTQHLPLKPIRGQVSYLPATGASRSLRTVICGEGYLPPAHNDRHCIGATFNLHETSTETRVEDHAANLDNLAAHAPALAETWAGLAPEQIQGRVGFRCATRDYLPIVGPAPIADAFDEDFAVLRTNARAAIPHRGRYWPGLYLNVGHGSRGLAYAPLSAALLADTLEGTPAPVAQELVLALHPGRFLIRQLIRNQR
ncbi:bifunctional tRNA (5-methylaminomethyl-2-thiouridine)(34)-methyltransferase MnmD/FAD-dependent 5-carboxymethylaminomethyl-2-thiouridine(34) oxidoreductase MnmC [Marinimicrobium alkaliphilum]|uniref:bifunctional tRNA (5-methylaminomethyl-2-thiouridine)(34)-methyltransferase MnmD/FAD-dependent 5-carboxymethylaminomethyl-2-thiouridine(34) oxidoreductase MnmC n=1 Tax=Marinimicrobium alkaliphilum TaxID=2202654 RepID=UPI000DBA52CB|nr:bifunctional tRNA (5-methylaminomethyl-2-thiouridine)(34)-methyltransferase MnmD/FAD-dependent 5-carboxymethylaminomethyl-2-thiouridine(34) oxidoreductase MnmC [Marinimicrobium alkaliphilum]